MSPTRAPNVSRSYKSDAASSVDIFGVRIIHLNDAHQQPQCQVPPGFGKSARGKGVPPMFATGKKASLLIAMALAVATARADAASVSFVQDFNTIDLDFTQYTPTGYTTSIGYSDGVGRAVSFTYDR